MALSSHEKAGRISAKIGKTQTTIWRSSGEVIGDPHPLTVDVKELT